MIERKEERVRAMRPIYLGPSLKQTYSAISIDYSRCGLCMRTSLDIKVGDRLRVFSPSLWHEPRDARVVRVSEDDDYGCRKAGFELCTSGSGF